MRTKTLTCVCMAEASMRFASSAVPRTTTALLPEMNGHEEQCLRPGSFVSKRHYPRGSQLVRGFILGQLYERGHTLTTARICKLGASRATARRDMKAIAGLVPVTPSKPLQGMRYYIAQRARKETTR